MLRPLLLETSPLLSLRWTFRSMARLMRLARSSGREPATPFSSMIWVMLLPVASLTLGTPYWSLRTSPILAEIIPSLASFTTRSSISVALRGTQEGFSEIIGRVEPDFPFLLVCILAIFDPPNHMAARLMLAMRVFYLKGGMVEPMVAGAFRKFLPSCFFEGAGSRISDVVKPTMLY